MGDRSDAGTVIIMRHFGINCGSQPDRNPADIYWAMQELYRTAPALKQEEYLQRDHELYEQLKAIKR